MIYKICVVTSSRAEYGILKPLLEKLKNDEDIELHIIATGTHLESKFGNTKDEIIKDGFEISACVKIPVANNSKLDMVKNTGETIKRFGEFFEKKSYDLIIILGDRYEIFAVATAAAMLAIPLAHIHGGETTEGAVDEFFRHSITKMSTLHFTACEEYRKRVIQLGENPSRVFAYGALNVENVINFPLMTIEELSLEIGVELEENKYFVTTFHPVTLENNTEEQQIYELIKAMDNFPQYRFIVTKSNADSGAEKINAIWEEESKKHSNWKVITSLGALRYLSAVKYSSGILGNSSSGIIEGPAMKVPTVNIGDRQKGRVMAESILIAQPNEKSIVSAIEKAIILKLNMENLENPFGGNDISKKMMLSIKNFLQQGKFSVKKTFNDIDFKL